MADLKISQLTGATTPLAGTEVVPVVQSSTTKKVAVSDLTAGRAVSGASFAVTGNTAPANGVYLFTANTVSIATDSTERFRVGSTGNLTSVGTGSGTAHTFYNTGSNSGARTMFSFNYITAAFSGYAAIKGVTETTYDDSLSLEFYTGGGTKRVTVAAGGDVTVNTGNLIQGTAAKGVTTSGAFSLGLGTNGSTSQATIDTSGNLSLAATAPDATTQQMLGPNTDKAWYFSKTCTTGATTNIFEVTGITNSSAINRRGVLEIWITMAGDNVNDQNGAALFLAPYYTGVFWNGIGATVTKLSGANTAVTMTLGVTASGSTLTFAITLGSYSPNHDVTIKTYIRSMYKDLTISAL